jgi:alpha-glucoside transport system permease protein
VHIVIGLFVVVWFTPLLGVLVGSVRTQTDTAASGWWHIVTAPLFTLYNYQQAIEVVGLGSSVATSLAIVIPSTVITTLLSAVGAYALVRIPFRGRTAISLALVALLVIPPQVTLIPMLKFFDAIGLQGTIFSVWIYMVGFALPYGIFLVQGFIIALPNELFESASLDGASHIRTFISVVVPLATPVLAALSILQFLWNWNDLLTPLVFLAGTSVPQPITVDVAGLVTATGLGQSTLLAAAVLSILLPLIILVSLQRYFVRGILGGSVKG